jgi:hypothetical protein
MRVNFPFELEPKMNVFPDEGLNGFSQGVKCWINPGTSPKTFLLCQVFFLPVQLRNQKYDCKPTALVTYTAFL